MVNKSHTFKLEAWADNWFAAYLNQQLIVEDSVPITTERSFNAEEVTFSADYPLTINLVIKDFKQNDTGLEYIGTPRQQMGDGGELSCLLPGSSFWLWFWVGFCFESVFRQNVPVSTIPPLLTVFCSKSKQFDLLEFGV